MSGRDLIDLLIKEGEAYTDLERMEQALQDQNDLSVLPMQPLYLALKNKSIEDVALYLPKLSKTQRQTFLDLDLWGKDDLDVASFANWVRAYDLCDDEKIRLEFVQSDEFALFLKARFNVWTFDVEEPEYPDHDNYFLTEDNQLLFEFHEDNGEIEEIQRLIRQLYCDLGVENAYCYLFKLVVDSSTVMLEDEYRMKKERLRDYGFVDYYDALEIDAPFAHEAQLQGFVKRKSGITGSIDSMAARQALHQSALSPYKGRLAELSSELLKVEDEKRRSYLHFNFIRLVNATLALHGGPKGGSVAMARAGRKARSVLELGHNYLRAHLNTGDEKGVLEIFDFMDVYKVGNTLIRPIQSSLKKAMQKYKFEDNHETFLGRYWTDFLDGSFGEMVKYAAPGQAAKELTSIDDYHAWKSKAETLEALCPFAKKFYDLFNQLLTDSRLMDEFYLNYNVDEIDLEAILLSSLANHALDQLQVKGQPKMGITIEEYRKFAQVLHLGEDGELKGAQKLIESFAKSFGFEEVPGIHRYLNDLLQEHMSGYDLQNLSEEEFEHVGGPIILNPLKH